MIAIAEMMDRLMNNLIVAGGILLSGLCMHAINSNLRRCEGLQGKKTRSRVPVFPAAE
jgi:hypothetical protein